MPDMRLDALVIQGANNLSASGGYFRWFTGLAADSYPMTAIFPLEDLMTIVCHGPAGGETELKGEDPAWPGVGLRLNTPSFSGIDYTNAYEAELVAQEVQRRKHGKIGYIATNQMSFGFGRRLERLLGGDRFVNATALVDPIKAIKSPEEIALLRRTAAMQDETLAKTLGHIRAGMREFEVMAYSQHVAGLAGSATGFFLGSSAPPGEPALIRTRPNQGRELRDGDIMFWQAENTGPGGLFVHMGRFIVLGRRAPQQFVDLHGMALEAQDFTVKLLTPGARCAEIFSEYQSYLRSRGLPEENRLHCHGQGYDVVERPLVRGDESMELAANMNIGIHPSWVRNNTFVTICDNFLLGVDGAERFHKTPSKVFAI
jgi:Xaa-Pro aminopeptidase